MAGANFTLPGPASGAGTIVRSWLLDLLVDALRDDRHLAALKGDVEDSGEGRCTTSSPAAPFPGEPTTCGRHAVHE